MYLVHNPGIAYISLFMIPTAVIWKYIYVYFSQPFRLNAFLFLVTLLCLTFSVVVAVVTPDPTMYDAPIHIARAVFEMWSLLAVVITLFIEINQLRK